MSMFSLLAGAAKIQMNSLLERKIAPVHTLTPLGLSQESSVKISQSYQLFAMSAGKSLMMPQIEESQRIIAVGIFKMGNLTLYRSYLSDEKSFVQTMPNSNLKDSQETQLFTMMREDYPRLPEEFNDLVGEGGFIGTPVLDVNTPDGKQARFERYWSPGSDTVRPADAEETITTVDGKQTLVRYQTMMYGRKVPLDDRNSLNEYLCLTLSNSSQGVSFIQSTGVDVDKSSLVVYEK